jgi:hypothetical protein
MLSAEKSVEEIVQYVLREVASSSMDNPPMRTLHEGFGVLIEEVDEFWEEVRKKRNARDIEKIRKELIQVAAVAVKIVRDVLPNYAQEERR